MNRSLIYQTFGKGSSQRVSQVLTQLETAYLKKHQRKLPPEMLCLAPGGDEKSPDYSIVAYYTPDQRAIVEFLQQTLENV